MLRAFPWHGASRCSTWSPVGLTWPTIRLMPPCETFRTWPTAAGAAVDDSKARFAIQKGTRPEFLMIRKSVLGNRIRILILAIESVESRFQTRLNMARYSGVKSVSKREGKRTNCQSHSTRCGSVCKENLKSLHTLWIDSPSSNSSQSRWPRVCAFVDKNGIANYRMSTRVSTTRTFPAIECDSACESSAGGSTLATTKARCKGCYSTRVRRFAVLLHWPWD